MKLKLPAPQAPTQPQPEMPPMGGQDMGEQPPMDAPQQNEDPFGKEKFDAGVEADEATDPKKYLEQLSGKLAQSLRKYNETTKDIELNKFIINSLVPAAIPQMDSENAQDVIKKVQDNIGKVDGGNATDIESVGQTEPAPEAPMPDEQQAPKMESKKSKKKIVKESETMDELVDRLLRGDDSEFTNKKSVGKKNIFKAPNFK